MGSVVRIVVGESRALLCHVGVPPTFYAFIDCIETLLFALPLLTRASLMWSGVDSASLQYHGFAFVRLCIS